MPVTWVLRACSSCLQCWNSKWVFNWCKILQMVVLIPMRFAPLLFSSAVKRLTSEILIFQVGFCVNVYNGKWNCLEKVSWRVEEAFYHFFLVFIEVFNKIAGLTSKSELDSWITVLLLPLPFWVGNVLYNCAMSRFQLRKDTLLCSRIVPRDLLTHKNDVTLYSHIRHAVKYIHWLFIFQAAERWRLRLYAPSLPHHLYLSHIYPFIHRDIRKAKE